MSSLTNRYSLFELAELAGTSPRTVRFYIQRGLINRPEGERRGSYYTARHLEQLLRIRKWTDAGLALERIAELLAEPATAPALPVRPGTVEVRSHIVVADGIEISVSPERAGLDPETLRLFVHDIIVAYAHRKGTPQE